MDKKTVALSLTAERDLLQEMFKEIQDINFMMSLNEAAPEIEDISDHHIISTIAAATYESDDLNKVLQAVHHVLQNKIEAQVNTVDLLLHERRKSSTYVGADYTSTRGDIHKAELLMNIFCTIGRYLESQRVYNDDERLKHVRARAARTKRHESRCTKRLTSGTP